MGLGSQMTWIKKEDFLHSPWKWHMEDFSTVLRNFLSCLHRIRNNLTLFCEESSTWSLHEFRKTLVMGAKHMQNPGPLWPTCMQAQLRHLQGTITVAWWCSVSQGGLPHLAWNRKDSIFTRMGSSRHFFRCISSGGLNCQNIFETVLWNQPSGIALGTIRHYSVRCFGSAWTIRLKALISWF